MERARGEFFLLLNSDAFPEPDAIRVLLEFMRATPRAGVAGPRTLNGDGSLQVSCYRLPSPAQAWLENLWLSSGYNRWAHDEQRTVGFVIGACMLVRRKTVEEVGGFDEQFFMYSEEADWQRRMHDQGWDVFLVPEARVVHLGGASGAHDRARINRYFFESVDRYARKHHGFVGLVALRAAMTVGCFLRACLWTANAIRPSQRDKALAKVRLHSWLVVRQLTHWQFGS
jgi:GT2 family glycosyltransferase